MEGMLGAITVRQHDEEVQIRTSLFWVNSWKFLQSSDIIMHTCCMSLSCSHNSYSEYEADTWKVCWVQLQLVHIRKISIVVCPYTRFHSAIGKTMFSTSSLVSRFPGVAPINGSARTGKWRSNCNGVSWPSMQLISMFLALSRTCVPSGKRPMCNFRS